MPGRMQRASNAGICGNGALEAGAQPCRFTARRATNGTSPSEAAQPKGESRMRAGSPPAAKRAPGGRVGCGGGKVNR